MLTARVISEGVRTVLPAVVTGVYTPEEVSDFSAPVEALVALPAAETVTASGRLRREFPKEAAPDAEVIGAMQDFSRASRAAGLDVDNEAGRPSKVKMLDLLAKVAGEAESVFHADRAGDWQQAAALVGGYAAKQKEAHIEQEVPALTMAVETAESDDPFAEEAKPVSYAQAEIAATGVRKGSKA
jgi:hypothetical protein